MHAFDVLGDPVRRRILELLADGERPSGAVTAVDPRRVRDLPARGLPAPAGAARGGLRDRPPGGRPAALRGEPGAAARGRRVARPLPPLLDARTSTRSPPSSPAARRRRRHAAEHRREEQLDDRRRAPDQRRRRAPSAARTLEAGEARIADHHRGPTAPPSTTSGTPARTPSASRAGSCRSPASCALGGRYQLEGNAGGDDRALRPAARLRRDLGVRRRRSAGSSCA